MTDAAGAPPPRRRWLIVALTVSLALNLFFVGAFAGSMRMIRPERGQHDRFEGIVGTLGLNDAQTAAFKQFQSAQHHGGGLHRTNAANWAKIADPATPTDQIAGLLEGTVKNRAEYQQGVASALGKFLATLTPEQRAKFIAEARQPIRRHGPWSRLRHLQ